jgi:hypothetical protein
MDATDLDHVTIERMRIDLRPWPERELGSASSGFEAVLVAALLVMGVHLFIERQQRKRIVNKFSSYLSSTDAYIESV